jgi:integrase
MTRPIRIGEASDLYLGELARRGRSPRTLDAYRRKLNALADSVRDPYVHEIELRDYEAFLNRWVGSAASTLAGGVSLVKGFSEFLWERGYTSTHVAYGLRRPRRPRAEDLDVVTVGAEDVLRMLQACETWQEYLCVATPLYLGARRRALALVRRRDVDLVRGSVRFVEKGPKVITKPLPDEYAQVLRAAEEAGVWKSGDAYLIPNRRPGAVRNAERSDKVIWETVRRVARRAGVNSHVHALRAAFAVQFDEANPGNVVGLKELLGHARIDQTLVYLRRKDKAKAMEAVRGLTWGGAGEFVFPPREEAARKKPPFSRGFEERRIRDSNPCRRRERAVSWATRRMRLEPRVSVAAPRSARPSRSRLCHASRRDAGTRWRARSPRRRQPRRASSSRAHRRPARPRGRPRVSRPRGPRA